MSDRQDFIEQRESDAAVQAVTKKDKYSDAYFGRKSVVYFLAAGWSPIKAIKIGVTARSTVKRRITSIQSSNHERIYLLGVLEFLVGEKPGLEAEREEAQIHKKFNELRRAKAYSVGAEWFDPAPSLLNFIQALPALPLELCNLYPPSLEARMADQARQ